MRASWSLLPKQTPRAAFRKLVACEARLGWRQPTGLIFGLGLPLLLLVIYGSVPALNKPDKGLGGLTFFSTQIPVLMAFVIAALAFWSLPAPLATYREQGILRRLFTTPAPPSWVLAAQLLVNLCLAALAVFILVVVGIAAFEVDAPQNPAGFVLAVLLTIAALFAMGLWVAAIARTGSAAGRSDRLCSSPSCSSPVSGCYAQSCRRCFAT
jgi:ABC-2 type transport system permease protein